MAKCASTSLKSFFFRLEHDRVFGPGPEADGGKGIHNFYKDSNFADVDHARLAEFSRVAVVRESVKRLMSCYANKVATGRWKVVGQGVKRIKLSELPVKPTVPEFLDNLDAYRKVSPMIRRHSMPLSFFLGTDPKYFDRIFGMSEVPESVDLVKERAGDIPRLPHKQKSTQKTVIEDLTEDQRSLIENHFAEDLEVFGAYM